MKSLFNIKNEYLQIADALTNGEVTQELEQALIINEAELQEKSVAYSYVIKSFEGNNELIDAEIKRLQELKKRNEKTIERMKSAVVDAMELYGIEKVESPTLKLSLRKSESVEVFNESELQNIYFTEKVTRTPNKTAIKEAFKQGNLVIGAHLLTKNNLQIK